MITSRALPASLLASAMACSQANDSHPDAGAGGSAGNPEAGVEASATAPTNVSVAPGPQAGSVLVYFTEPTGDGNGTLGYTVVNDVDTVTGTGNGPPITVRGLTAGQGYRFTVKAASTAGEFSSVPTGLLYFYDVVETFDEPVCDPNDTIFTGSFTFDASELAVSHLAGSLTQAMTMVNGVYGGPMTTVDLGYQLSSEAKTLGGVAGLLVTTFALDTTDVFTGGGFAPCGTQYYGLQERTPNNHNAYAMVFVNTGDPTATLGSDQIVWLAYADCTTGGMMGSTCMTGTSDTEGSYGCPGTMMGTPVSQVISPR